MWRDRHWPHRRAIDEDVGEMAVGGRRVAAFREDADAVGGAGAADAADGEAGFHNGRMGYGGAVGAAALGTDADHRPALDIQPGPADQEVTDHRVEPRVIDHVVYVAVLVVVLPA